MTPLQTTTVAVIVLLLVVAAATFVAIRWGQWNHAGDVADRELADAALRGRHVAGRVPPVVVRDESPSDVLVAAAPEEGLISGDLYRRARNGQHPQIVYSHDETGDVLTFGPYGNRVVYRLGGMHPKHPDTYYAVRIA